MAVSYKKLWELLIDLYTLERESRAVTEAQ